MTGVDPPSSSNVVIFRTHFWDQFAQRQFGRLLARARNCDVYILVDETNGPVQGITHDRVVRVTETEMLGMGLPRAGEGNLLWFNGDYPLYRFMERHPGYVQYLQLEYDVVINMDIAALLGRMRAEAIDFIGLTKGEPSPDWFWRESCAGLYDAARLSHELICICAFSARALEHLYRKRLQHAGLLRAGAIAAWPMCEAFIPTELAAGGFRLAELSEFGDTGAYDHWPPYLEDDLVQLSNHCFIHPVLDQPRYIGSMLKYRVGVSGYLRPDSLFHRKLRRLPIAVYLRALATSFAAKVVRVLHNAIRADNRQDKAA
jgi:hypothetical protein